MRIVIDSKQFIKDMDNIVNYSIGFLDGIHVGKEKLFQELGKSIKQQLEGFIDSNARVDPKALQHVYEWYQPGNPGARLFNIEYTISNLGLSLRSTFRQSTSIKDGSTTPFYNKAKIMEDGIPVTIRPKKSEVLAFEDNGDTVFTKNPVTIQDPGGQDAQGSYQAAFDSFFRDYFSQSFMSSSGMGQYLKNPTLYKNNFAAGKRGGKSLGVETGIRWITNAGAYA